MRRFLFGSGLLLGGAASFAQPPVNDMFSNRLVLAGTNVTATANLSFATNEAGEPHAFLRSVWWEWTAEETMGMAVATAGSPAPPEVLVYSGDWLDLNQVSRPASILTSAAIRQSSFRAEAGTTYYIAVASTAPNTTGSVSLTMRRGPTNDDFANATEIKGGKISTVGDLNGATLESGESTVSTNTFASVWWKWSPGTRGVFVIEASRANSLGSPTVRLVIYRGSSLPSLERMGSAERYPNSRLRLEVEDEIYFIAVENIGSDLGPFELRIQSAPANDLFENRLPLTGLIVSETFLFTGAGREPGEPAGTNTSVWWEWTAPITMNVGVQARATQFAPGVEIYTGGGLPDLVLQAAGTARINSASTGFRAVAGQNYIIRVLGGEFSSGYTTLDIIPGPANDDFARAEVIAGEPATAYSTLFGATREPGEALVDERSTGASVWWIWEAERAGAFSLQAAAGDGGVAISVYQGAALEDLLLIGRGFKEIGGAARVTVQAEAGERFYVQVADLISYGYPVSLTVRAGPTNDNFAGAIPVHPEMTTGTTRGATAETDEPAISGLTGQSVWYFWIPENPGGYELEVSGAEAGNSLLVFEGTSLEELSLVWALESTWQSASGSFRAEEGKAYYLMVDGRTSGGADFWFRITPGPPNDDFADRARLEGAVTSVVANTQGGTREPGEPEHEGESNSRTLWWEWVAPHTGTFAVTIAARGNLPGCEVYQGESLSTLLEVPTTKYELEEWWGYFRRYWAFRAEEGERYFIVLHSEHREHFTMHLREGPPNDNFADGIPLELNEHYGGSNVGGTVETGEPGPRAAGATVWHRFTAPTSGTYAVWSEEAYPLVYRGNSFAELSLATPWVAPDHRSVSFSAQAGETVHIVVDSYRPGFYGVIVGPGAANDYFANRELVVDRIETPSMQWSTLEPGEPVHSTNFQAGSLWWKWIAPESGTFRIQVNVPYAAAVLAVYQGSELADLERRARVEAPGEDTYGVFPNALFVDLAAEEGVEYAIAFSDPQHTSTGLVLEILPADSNDALAGALALETGVELSHEYRVATLEAGENWSSAKGTLWYKWTAPADATYQFSASQGRLDLGVFTGDSIEELNEVAVHWNLNPAVIGFRAEAGETYRLGVGVRPVAEAGTVTVVVEQGHPHDDFELAEELTGRFVLWEDTTRGATSQPGEESIISNQQTASVWGHWVAPESAFYRAISQNAAVGVYRGGTLSELEPVGNASVRGYEFMAEEGVAYKIRAAAAVDLARDFTVRLGPVALNETRGSAVELAGTEITAASSNWTGVASEEMRPDGLPVAAAWWKWRAPANGILHTRFEPDSSLVFAVFHNHEPSLHESVFVTDPPRYSTHPGSFSTRVVPASTNTIAVVEGTEYVIGLGGAPATNLTMHLSFAESPVNLGSPNEMFFGGNAFWHLQDEVTLDGEPAWQADLLLPREEAWMEMVFHGRGTLTFQARRIGYSPVRFARFPDVSVVDLLSALGPNWMPYTFELTRETNVVRWTVGGSSLGPVRSGTAWVADIAFAPHPVIPPELRLQSWGQAGVRLTVPVQAYRPTVVEYSADLVEWSLWTNFSSTLDASRSLVLPIDGEGQMFFRARVGE